MAAVGDLPPRQGEQMPPDFQQSLMTTDVRDIREKKALLHETSLIGTTHVRSSKDRHQCAHCGKADDGTLKKCVACSQVLYCNVSARKRIGRRTISGGTRSSRRLSKTVNLLDGLINTSNTTDLPFSLTCSVCAWHFCSAAFVRSVRSCASAVRRVLLRPSPLARLLGRCFCVAPRCAARLCAGGTCAGFCAGSFCPTPCADVCAKFCAALCATP